MGGMIVHHPVMLSSNPPSSPQVLGLPQIKKNYEKPGINGYADFLGSSFVRVHHFVFPQSNINNGENLKTSSFLFLDTCTKTGST